MNRSSLLLRASALVLPLSALAGCSGDEPEPAAPLPLIADARVASIAVQPEAFCDRIDGRAVKIVVGDDPEATHYGNGDRAELAPGLVDVAHEYGCVLTAASGEQARAWVVVPPVAADRADDFRPGKKCEVEGGGLGDPGYAASCTTKGAVTLSLAGLYTDVWFGCSLRVPDGAEETGPSRQERLETWCAAAVQAAARAS